MSNLEQERPEQPPRPEMSYPPKNILIVDDNAVNRKLLRLTLQAENYTTVDAADGIEALAALKLQAFDIVVSDILMPNMDGYALCKEVRRCSHLKTCFSFFIPQPISLRTMRGLVWHVVRTDSSKKRAHRA